MARDKKSSGNPSPELEEMTVVVLKFKGGSESLQKGFDAVTQAIAALGAPVGDDRRLLSSREHHPKPPKSDVIDALGQDVDDSSEENGDEVAGSTGGAAKPRRPGNNKPAYKFMDDYLSPEGVPSLKDYCAEKKPGTVDDKFLVASAWVQTHGGADPFTGGHLFTAFRAMGWKTQIDMTQPLRTLKSKKSYYDNPSFGKWKLTRIGLDAAAGVSGE